MADELTTDISTDAGTIDVAPPSPPANEPPPAVDTTAAAGADVPSGDDTPESKENPYQGIFDEIDNIGTDREVKEPIQPPADPSSLLSDESGVAQPPNPDADKSQSQAGKADDADDAQKATDSPEPEAEPDPADAEKPADEWNKLSEEDEKYITKHLPKVEWKNARKAFRDAAMARAYANPSCPADQFVTNLEQKSAMRFGEVETAILKRGAEKDPTEFLGKLFQATAAEDGNSDAYQRLLDTAILTNTDYVVELLGRNGKKIVDAGQESGTQANLPDVADAEIDELEASIALQQLAETFPEEAEKLKAVLAQSKSLKAEKSAFDEAKQKEESEKKSEDTTKEQEAAAAQAATRVKAFNEVYEEAVTSHVTETLDKTYALKPTDQEREQAPLVAFLKDAKRTLIMAGGINGSGDFDNDLYEWGKTRPAFKQAAEAMVKFTSAGEKDNARGAAGEFKDFAKMFLDERIKLPDVAMVDQLIEIVLKAQKQGLVTKDDVVPHSPTVPGSPAAGGNEGVKGFLDEIDNMRA
ncbi:MAG: hypothetical protein ABL984_13955 [Pyrinomonadaceae bacterium]